MDEAKAEHNETIHRHDTKNSNVHKVKDKTSPVHQDDQVWSMTGDSETDYCKMKTSMQVW